MSQITRNTSVLSVSLDANAVKALNYLVDQTGQTKSAAISSLIKKASLLERWRKLREIGKKTAKKMNITSEEDVYRILGDA